jgi:hypothetical protein
MTRKQANALLPDKATSWKITPHLLVFLLVAPPKWGKTKFFMSNPDALLLAFEAGHRFRRGHKIEIVKWDQRRGSFEIEKDEEGVPRIKAEQALEVLEATDKYNFVIMDTVDMAAKMCMDYHCEKLAVAHPSDAGDFGKGWDVTLNSPMRKYILAILKTGRGVGFVTHTKIEIARFTSGETARKESTMPSGVARFCISQADVMIHGELGKKRPPNKLRDRILVCEGDLDTLAGNRSDAPLPERFIVSPDKPWQQFTKFFVDPKAVLVAEREYKKIYKR